MATFHQFNIALLRAAGYSETKVISLDNVPSNSLTSAFMRFIEDDMRAQSNPFRLSPFQLFLVGDQEPNACAIHYQARSVVIVHSGLLGDLHRYI